MSDLSKCDSVSDCFLGLSFSPSLMSSEGSIGTPKPTAEGSAAFIKDDKVFSTWYQVYGDLHSARPLVLLHGGPGLPSDYMLPFAYYLSSTIPVVIYDQLGCGRSSHPRESVPTQFWNVEVFMDELENLLKHLQIDGDFDLLGQSWGGMSSARSPEIFRVDCNY